MSSWLVAATILNVGLVATTIALALRIGSPSALAGVERQWKRSPVPLTTTRPDAVSRFPRFNLAQMERIERRALLDAFDAALTAHLRELAVGRREREPSHGSLARARHDLKFAWLRLARFEREISRSLPLVAPTLDG